MAHHAVTSEQIERAVVTVLAAVIGRTEDEIRDDDGRYGAYQWDDGFVEYLLWECDWEVPQIDVEFETEDWIFGRTDLDLARAVIEDEHFVATSTTDVGLRGLFESQGGALYGAQLAELVRDGRFELEQFDYPTVFSRIRATGETLVEAATALFMLNDFENLHLVPGEFAEVDEDWVELIDSIEPPELAAHFGMFFQEAQSARCCGAALTGPDEGTFVTVAGSPHQEIVVSWWIGEGQGDCYLARILEDRIPEVPAFRGRELLTRPAVEPRAERSRKVASSEEVLSIPLRKHLEGAEHEDYRAFLEAAGERDLEAFIAGMSLAQGSLWKLLIPIRGLDREGNAHAALAVLNAARGVMTSDERKRTELRWATYLHELGCFDEALDAFARCEEYGPLCSEMFMRNFAQVHAAYARAALDAERFELALEKADESLAVEEWPETDAVKACALFALGEVDAAFELLERVMRHGVDPLPQRALAEHPRYRELALEHSIPVPLFTE